MQPQMDTKCRKLVARHMLHLVKFQLNMARLHPVSFGLLPNTQQLVYEYWHHAKAIRERQRIAQVAANEDETYFYERFNHHALLLLRACCKIAYQTPHAFNSRQKADAEEKKQVVKTISQVWLSDVFLMDVFDNLLNKFFVCVPTDLEEWNADGEEWEMKEEGTEDALELSVRPCAERLFMDIVINHKDLTRDRFAEVSKVLSSAYDSM